MVFTSFWCYCRGLKLVLGSSVRNELNILFGPLQVFRVVAWDWRVFGSRVRNLVNKFLALLLGTNKPLVAVSKIWSTGCAC